MKKYDNNLRGALFMNGRKALGTKQPDVYGTVEIDGREYKIAGWNNVSAKGTSYMSLKLTPADTDNYEETPTSSDLPAGIGAA